MTLATERFALLTLQLAENEIAEFRTKSPAPRRFPWLLTLMTLLLVGAALFPVGWSKAVRWRYAPVTYHPEEYQAAQQAADTDVNPGAAPAIAIVFGARVYSRERLSAMLRDRMDTAIEL